MLKSSYRSYHLRIFFIALWSMWTRGESNSRLRNANAPLCHLTTGPLLSGYMVENIIKNLNPKQREAVKIVNGPVLVISGPGSGKTKCLTHRTAYLIASGIRPENVLALTFTNKAAGEMKERIFKLLQATSYKLQAPTIGTFHSIGLRILRIEIERLGYGKSFTIFDTDDQLRLVKKIMADLEMDTKRFNPRSILAKISELKTSLIWPENYRPADFFQKVVAKLYLNYQTQLKELNGVDFDDLIVLCVKLFKNHPEVLKKYQNVWHYILVDEYQDTSHDQYKFVTMLASQNRNLFCIGDDAQSIYQFRRADIRNILNFQKDYPEAKIVMLEQNYRSTKNILAAAQGVISKNQAQIPKELWTENDHGHKILAKELLNERVEANYIISKISGFVTQGRTSKDFAILYRTHAQSRAIEEALISAGFPYQIVGGIKFYERKEIKDMLAYLRFLINPSDIISFERIYNVPTRGLGKSAYEKIISGNKPNLIDSMDKLASEAVLPAKKLVSLREFNDLIKNLAEAANQKEPTQLIKYIIKETDYEDYLRTQGTKHDHDTSEDKIENLKELLTVAGKYNEYGPGKEGIGKFLEEVALLQETDRIKSPNGDHAASQITLMTMHASKGLEFPVVFIVGMEEGLFPHSRTLFDPKEIEEERRLCYVAMTRAKENLIITFAKARSIFGSREFNLPSRFIGEMPQHVLDYEFQDFDKEEIIEY